MLITPGASTDRITASAQRQPPSSHESGPCPLTEIGWRRHRLRARSGVFRSAAGLLISGLALAVPAAKAQTSPTEPTELANASLEELMNIEVTSVSRKEQKLAQAAAAVYVITQDEIRSSGATNVPDLLRMVPGVHVAQLDANIW